MSLLPTTSSFQSSYYYLILNFLAAIVIVTVFLCILNAMNFRKKGTENESFKV